MKNKKYIYYAVIQGHYGGKWEDEDFHECDSSGYTLDKKLLTTNLRAYRENGGGHYRVIKRRELAA